MISMAMPNAVAAAGAASEKLLALPSHSRCAAASSGLPSAVVALDVAAAPDGVTGEPLAFETRAAMSA